MIFPARRARWMCTLPTCARNWRGRKRTSKRWVGWATS